jgi:uncharacterized UBP type Zn finger protein
MRSTSIETMPNILILNLKRLTYNFDQMRKIKINDGLEFPELLNIKAYTNDN